MRDSKEEGIKKALESFSAKEKVDCEDTVRWVLISDSIWGEKCILPKWGDMERAQTVRLVQGPYFWTVERLRNSEMRKKHQERQYDTTASRVPKAPKDI